MTKKTLSRKEDGSYQMSEEKDAVDLEVERLNKQTASARQQGLKKQVQKVKKSSANKQQTKERSEG